MIRPAPDTSRGLPAQMALDIPLILEASVLVHRFPRAPRRLQFAFHPDVMLGNSLDSHESHGAPA